MSTIIQQGRFTSNGQARILQIRSDVDWIRVYNETALAQAAADLGAEFYWQRGMASGRGIVWTKLGTVANDPLTIGQIAANAGFTLIDSSVQQPGALTAVTSIDNATPPEVTVASTAALNDGDVVRLFNIVGGQQLGGIDFTIDVTSGTTFQLEYMPAIAAATTGFYRVIPFDPIFYPRRRYISKISQAAQAIVTMTVTHGYIVGQKIRFIVPAEYGMVELDQVEATIVAVGQADADGTTNTITVDVDTSAFTAFAFPLTADVPFNAAQVVPLGEDTAQALTSGTDILSDATLNTAYIGIKLAAGINSPAGQNNDIIYWIAGKSFSVNN